MNSGNKSLTKDLKQLLNNYLGEESVTDFIRKIEQDALLDLNNKPGKSDKEILDIEYDLPRGIDYRLAIDRVITHCANELVDEKYFNLILELSQLMFFAGEISYSLEMAEDLLTKLSDNKEFSNILAETYLMISKVYWSQADWDECDSFISKAIKIFKSINCKAGLAKCENMLGTLYGEKGDFKAAEKHLNNALNYLSEQDDLSARAMILTNLGIINTVKCEFEKSIWNYKSAAEIFNELKDVRRASRVYHNIGMLYTKMQNYDAALDEFNKCISLSINNDYLSNCAMAYIGKAYIYSKLNNPALAEAYTEKAMEIAYKLNDTLSIADIYRLRGMIQNDMQNFELSEEMFENSIRLNKDIENKLNEAESADQLGKLLEKNNRYEEAKPYLQTASNFFNELKQEKSTAGLIAQSI